MKLKIKELRKQKKVSQDDLAVKTGISARMIFDYERQKIDIPIQKLQLIANCLQVSIFDLIELEPGERFDSNDANEIFKALHEPRTEYEIKSEVLQAHKKTIEVLENVVLDLRSNNKLLQKIVEEKCFQ